MVRMDMKYAEDFRDVTVAEPLVLKMFEDKESASKQ